MVNLLQGSGYDGMDQVHKQEWQCGACLARKWGEHSTGNNIRPTRKEGNEKGRLMNGDHLASENGRDGR